MKCRYPYSFEEFQTHLEAMSQVSQWQHLHLTDPPTEVGTLQTRWARSGRIIEYFNDTYSDKLEALDKGEVFMAVHEYISEHLRYFKWHKLLKPSETEGKALISHGLFRAVHFAVTKLGTGADINKGKIVKLAKAFNAIYPNT